MIAFGVTVAEPEAYRRYAGNGIALAAEPDSRVFAFATSGTVGQGANLLLDAAAALPDLEALVILHPHAEIADPRFCEKVRAALADPEVAVAGCAGATGVRSIAWWEGQVSAGEVIQRYNEHGGGEVPAYSWTERTPPPATVEALDGFLLALSPWAVHNVRFDEGLHLGFGFDVDYCLNAQAHGRRVVTFDARIIQHRSVELIETIELWVEAHIAFAQKWDERLLSERDVKARARRGEAEREAERTVTYFRRLSLDVRIEQLEQAVAAATSTRSWRATQPLRDLNAWRRSRFVRRRGAP
jgi:hypothetical protein